MDAQQRLRSLARMASYFSGLQGERELLSEVRDSLMVYFEYARVVEVFLVDQTGQELLPVFRPSDGRRLLGALCSGIESIPVAKRKAPVIPDLIPYLVVPNLTHGSVGVGPMMAAPLLSGTALLGLIVVQAVEGAPDFTLADLDALSSIAKQTSAVSQNARARQRSAEKPLLQHDLELARRIQRSFLPTLARSINGFRIAAEYRPAFDVGGDFYDVVSPGPGRITAVVGDVSGKGVSAALVMSRVSSEFHRLASSSLLPHEILTQLNASFASLSIDDTFVTAVCVAVDASQQILTVANAGHVPPLIRHANGLARPMGCVSGLPIGTLASESYADEQFKVGLGDIVVMMTDGAVEPLTRDEDPIGIRALLQLMAEAPADVAEINRRILRALEEAPVATRADDIALLSLEVGEVARLLAA